MILQINRKDYDVPDDVDMTALAMRQLADVPYNYDFWKFGLDGATKRWRNPCLTPCRKGVCAGSSRLRRISTIPCVPCARLRCSNANI